MRHSHPRRSDALPLLALAAGAGLAVWAYGGRRPPHPADSAPGRTARQSNFGGYTVGGRTVTINKPRSEIYAFWRDFGNLPRFMRNVERVETLEGDRSAWTIRAPQGAVRVVTRLVSDRENEEMAWRSTEDSDIDTEGKVMFRDAPGGRGTEVTALVAYRPPYGQLGHWIAKLYRNDPRTEGRHELKRLKMLLETGEIATSRNRPNA